MMTIKKHTALWSLLLSLAAGSVTADEGIAARVIRAKPASVDLILYPMGVKDVVTLVASMPAGDAFAVRDGGNIAVATLTGMLLDKGTVSQDKFAIARQLDGVGAQLSFAVDGHMLRIEGKALKKDVPTLLSVLAQELREPAFSAEELDKAKKQLIGGIKQRSDNTDARAREAFVRAVYTQGHANRWSSSQEWIAAAERGTLDEVQMFHRKHYGPAHLKLVLVGDVDAKSVQAAVARNFAGWSGGVAALNASPEASARNISLPKQVDVPVPGKTSVSVRMGQATGLRYRDPDALALRMGTAILGSGFTGRLMSTVRDREGLTYSIGTILEDDTFVDGSWSVVATFAPALFEKGVASTRRELDKWWQYGVTADELAARKTNMIGAFQVGLASTDGMADALLMALERGYALDWLDSYPGALDALTVDQVNAAIRKHLDPRQMVLIGAGTAASLATE